MSKPFHVHYLNKYPGGNVITRDDSIDVTCVMGKPRIALRKNGAGQWVDQSAEYGCLDRHDLAPIPRDSRVFKLTREGDIQPDERAQDRAPIRDELAALPLGGPDKVPSIAELALSANPRTDVRSLDPRFEYGTWEHRPRNARGAARAAELPYQPGLQVPPAYAQPPIPAFNQ